MRAFAIIITGIIFLNGCSSTHQQNKQKKAKIFYQYGSQQMAEGNYTIALENLIKAHKKDPLNPDITNNLALAYYYKKRPGIAKSLLKDLIKNHPEYPDAFNNLGTLYMKEQNMDEAEKYFNMTSQNLLFKKQFITYYNLSKVFAAKNNLPLAKKYIKKSLEENDRYCPALFQRGWLSYKQKKWEQAQKFFKQAIKGACYNYIASHFYQALTLKQLNKLNDAEKVLMQLKDTFPKSSYVMKADLELNTIRQIKDIGSDYNKGTLLKVPKF